MICNCVTPDPEGCTLCLVDEYRMRDARITIGLPILQDNGELEHPGYIDDILIAYYATPGIADTALHNIMDVGAFRVPDVDFAPAGWAE